ncbi:stefin-2-like [Pungitius pungitius]|uniref:stefin-2-like n=1 Tax=Pungitius pungitius TaxID=134920 RepID=UPI002E14F47B
MAQIPGGWSEPKDADKDIQKICDQVKDKVQKMTGQNYHAFKAIQYKKQTVNGYNFLIKVLAGEKDYLHLRLFQASSSKAVIELKGVEQHKTKGDPL